MDFAFSYSLKQLISTPTRTTENTATLIDHVLTNSPHKIIKSGVVEVNLSDHELIYCTRKTTKLKSNKRNETYACVNMAYLDFVTKIVDVIDSYCPSKRVRIKGNTKPWFDSEVISLVNKRDSCYKKCKVSKLETDKDLLREAKRILKATIQRKKGTFFKIRYKKTRKILKSFGKP